MRTRATMAERTQEMACSRFRAVLAIVAVTVVALATSAGAAIIFADDFESPDVGTSEPIHNGVPATTRIRDTAKWVGATQGYGATSNGLLDEAGGAFTDPDGEQAYGFRYTNSGVTTVEGVLGALGLGTYTVSFNVVEDGVPGFGGPPLPYRMELVAFDPGDNRTECRTNARPGTVLDVAAGNAPSDGSWATITRSFTALAGDASLGKDLGIRFIGAAASAIIDDVSLDAPDTGGGPEWPVLKVDFNSTNQDGGPHNQAGFEPYDAGHEVAADFDTKTYSAFGTTVSVTPDWPNTTDNRVRQMIDRGSGNDNNWNNADGDIDLVTDWLGIDTRTGNGGNGNWDGTTGTPTYMTLTLGGLPAAMYEWKSFHHDTENVHGDFTVEISTDGGATWEALLDGLMTDSTPGGNPDSSGFTPPGPWVGPDVDLLLSTYEFSFVADGQNDVLLRFAPLSNTGVHRQLWGINGFELTIIPEPTTLSLLGLGGLLALRRRRRRRRR